MYTQCPHCHTLFRISADQLKAAAGKAHCCRCDQVFSALNNLREREPEHEDTWPESRFIDDLPEEQNLELPFDDPVDSPHQELHSGLTDLLRTLQINPEPTPFEETETDDAEHLAIDDDRDPFEPAYDLNDGELDSVQIGLDSRFCGPLMAMPTDEDNSEQANSDTAEPDVIDADTEPSIEPTTALTDEDEALLPFPVPDNLPELQPTEQQALSVEDTLASPGHSRGTFGWSVVIVILLLLVIGQLSWFGRSQLLQYPAGRQAMEQVCEMLSCQLPPRRDPAKIAVVSRSISTHPDFEDTLLVMLTLRNQAAFEQPFPTLELSLLDSAGALIARRSFSPEEYHRSSDRLIQPGVPESLKLELQDPGAEVVGFQFDFY
ncbi:DUF3426 domain-containing protein [Sedimenticola selenatireducens]|uniref:DUF3426 domain-containing protein n=1 Tax=Sedimenticola selenatireducens TaxID=191960 RepID=A0A557SGQ6_9GAMM|nr:DUF3426 domain-containing protein [Sedimenticola selenatireducens]TVO76598.1 DUF3426 domain-containing protein [Sedimenticola selenatireducens]TVT64042.1 MAG: DUF3426 domain-containing protein [Sedimenticola selenatireducens]